MLLSLKKWHESSNIVSYALVNETPAPRAH